MELAEYQKLAKTTIQENAVDQHKNDIVPFLGIVGEIGSLLNQLKIKVKDGDSYIAYKGKLAEELGDVLWYVATIASENGIELEKIAQRNIEKTYDRYLGADSFKDFDQGFPETEKLPDEFEIEFIPVEGEETSKLKNIDKRDGSQIGDPLTDNNYDDDGYRFHDIFHYGYLAILGWSPVLRKLLMKKRKSNPLVDEVEDGARAQITEEMISLYIYHHAVEHDLLKDSKSVDSGIIKKVQSLAKRTEVKVCSGKQWENAILNSYKVFNELRTHNGGRVLVSKKKRSLIYLGSDS